MNAAIPHTTSGGALTSCDMDEACPAVDCTQIFEEYGDSTLTGTPEGALVMAHLCGLEFPHDWQEPEGAE
ncbi:MAG: hypothetical protein HZB71_12535 [Betaproteobacteria bacterium]|nr:hypothetical protein [Betaproteobacteria bacterium]